jgi:hypothetical protein
VSIYQAYPGLQRESLLPPSAAKYSLDGDIFFVILLRKIRKKMSLSEYNLARSAMKRLFTQPLKI